MRGKHAREAKARRELRMLYASRVVLVVRESKSRDPIS